MHWGHLNRIAWVMSEKFQIPRETDKTNVMNPSKKAYYKFIIDNI